MRVYAPTSPNVFPSANEPLEATSIRMRAACALARQQSAATSRTNDLRMNISPWSKPPSLRPARRGGCTEFGDAQVPIRELLEHALHRVLHALLQRVLKPVARRRLRVRCLARP